jgi:tetratricopeptide (TPR) repeat protein
MNSRFLKNFAFSLLICCFSITISAQKSEMNANSYTAYNHAKKLYNNKAYAAAQKTFKDVVTNTESTETLKSDAAYYSAMCAIKLNQVEAERMVIDFVDEHPNSNKKEKAFLNVGNYYFANKKAAYALKWYAKVNRKILSKANQKELDFKMGYAMLATGSLKLARKKFLPLINDPQYGNDSRYYYGYIAYKQEDYEEAETHLTEIAKQASYKSEVTYYLLDISFKDGRFEKCIEIGKKLLKDPKQKEKSDISKIIGESYFNLKKYNEALPYLRNYKGKRGKWNNTDYYQLGYTYYKQNDFENAVKNFNKIIDDKNNVSQNAYYHLAECYLYLERKPEALNAFKSASEMDFDAKIKEDAFLNYAKLSYEEGNPYKSVAEVLQDFLIAYPKSPYYQEINQLVVTSYLYQQDYQGALDYLAKKKSKENRELTKDVSYYRGVQLFNLKKLQEAYPYFETATNSSDSTIKVSAMYWKAETDFQLSNFQQSLDGFTKFKSASGASKIEEYASIDYNIAYSYFKLKDYDKAARSFNRFTSRIKEDNPLLDDANIRLADCYFVTKKYANAIKAYDKVINNLGVGSDYAVYQKAISYGFLGDNSKKIQNLSDLVRNYEFTSLLDDALFQLANTFVTVKNNTKAHETYNILLTNHSKSSYIPKALLRQGLVYYNDNENQQALTKFKKIVSDYPNSSEAREAVNNARNVYVDLGQVDVYATWVKNISFANVTDADLDNTTYEAAENKFLENDTNKAIEGFTKYVNAYPNGLHAIKANFYLAQLLFKTNQEDKAITNYQFVIDKGLSEYSEEALNKLSQIYLEDEKWKSATPLLIRLEQEANYPQNILFAQSNLMKAYYQDNIFEKAVEYAEKVLQKDKLEENVEFDAKIIIARSAFKTDDLQRAEEFYNEVERNASGELKAEALYYNAYFKNQNKKYKESNKVVQKLIADYSTYKYWGVKSYVIMAKNYYGLKDAYQATYILENIIKNFSQFDDVMLDAKKELTNIKNNEAKTNESVTPNNN